MGIKGVSDVVQLPRLGKIRLGIKVEKEGKAPYPQATDYFVCPPEVQKLFGEKPRKLEIMFPVENPDVFAQQWLRCYSMTQGLVCIGDGETSRRKVDKATGGIAYHNTVEWVWKEQLPCNPEECPEYAKKQCRRVMNLQFLMPKVPGLGVWQIDTTSFYSIVNVNSSIKLIRGLCDRIAFIPLTLCLVEQDVSPMGQKKKKVRVLHIEQNIRLYDMLLASQQKPAQLIMPQPEAEEAPDDLYPPEVIEEAEARRAQPAGGPTTAAPSKLDLEWALIRQLQRETHLDDDLLKSYVRLGNPELKDVVKGPLPDTTPPWLTMKIATPLRKRLKAYASKIKEQANKKEGPSAEPPQEKTDPDHPWEQMKSERESAAQAAAPGDQSAGTEAGLEPELDI